MEALLNAATKPSARWGKPEYWRRRHPALHIESTQVTPEKLKLKRSQVAARRAQMLQEGYFELPDAAQGLPLDAMAAAVSDLARRGQPTPLAFVYDDFWALFERLDPVVRAVLGPGYWRLPDFWAWHVNPKAAQSGWSPHRDKGRTSLFADGTPKSVTIWVALTEATPLNGCMYLVPADRDPVYGTRRENDWRHALSDVRALPTPAGGGFCWNQAVLHWGSHTSTRAVAPRIAVAMEFQAANVAPMNEPLMAPTERPSFEQRLQLIGQQLGQYVHMQGGEVG